METILIIIIYIAAAVSIVSVHIFFYNLSHRTYLNYIHLRKLSLYISFILMCQIEQRGDNYEEVMKKMEEEIETWKL